MKKNKNISIYYLTLALSLIYQAIEKIFLLLNLKPVVFWMADKITSLFGDVMRMSKEYDGITGKLINKVILAIPSYGCSHYFKTGGCAMCGFNEEIKKYRLRDFHTEAIILLTKIFLISLKNKLEKNFEKSDRLTIFMAGSFLNNEELPLRAQILIFNFFRISDIKEMEFETRAEYVRKYASKLKNVIDKLKGKKIRISIGLETSNDKIRNTQVRKKLSKKEYEIAVRIARKAGADINTYILIGLPFLSENEIVTNAVQSASYALNSGSNVVSLEAYCVQNGTKWKKLFEKGWIKPPSLKCIIETVKLINKFSPHWQLGEFADWPNPFLAPMGCEKCHVTAIKTINYLRISHDFGCLIQNDTCSCI